MIFTSNSIAFEMIRGDSYTLPITINKGTQLDFEHYALSGHDRLYVGIMEPNQAFEDAIIRKVLTEDSTMNENGDVLFQLEPQDTEYLMTGKYYISIKLKQFDTVTTILPPKEFWITGSNPPTNRVITEDVDENIIILDGGVIT